MNRQHNTGPRVDRDDLYFRRILSLSYVLILFTFVFIAVSPRDPRTAPARLFTADDLQFGAPGANAVALPLSDPLPAQRRLYPYSVIPGGAQNAQELMAAAHNDPVVAAHYADFDMAQAREITLDHDLAVYVSYRMGRNVFWTNKKIQLHKGETLLTDGKNEARTRCGNRVSEEKQAPLAPAASQPELEAFDRSAPVAPLVAENLPLDGGALVPPSSFPSGLGFPSPEARPAVVYPSPFLPFVPGPGQPVGPSVITSGGGSAPGSPSGPSSPGSPSGGTPGSPSSPGSPSGPGTPSGPGSPGSPSGPGSPGSPGSPSGPPVSTPEPGTLLMLVTGLSGLGLLRKFRRR